MAKDYFKFKQFTVYQEKAGLRVCTDSCILGAWASPRSFSDILDIGSGTGLLSLMLAQRTDCSITAIELDDSSYKQAQRNIECSPWASQICLLHTSLQDFMRASKGSVYDFVICNPPFFGNHLTAKNAQKKMALHNENLSMPDLLEAVQHLLRVSGVFLVMYPAYEASCFAALAAEYGLFCWQRLQVYHSPQHSKVFRTIQVFQKEAAKEIQEDVLFIKDQDGVYHPDFEHLLRAYYIIF